tara:strand:- start:45 stop:311 length:267 start_codon:yes stop_codon:yes gene_type:complete
MNRHDAILKLYPNVISIDVDVAYDIEGNKVTYDNTAVEAELAANAYKQKRLAEYPTWNEQLDNIYHNGIDAWKADIKAIKDKYPKGDE